MIEPLRPDTRAIIDNQMIDNKNEIGVAYSPRLRKWRAYLHIGRKQVYHGVFETKGDAVDARKAAELKYGSFTARIPAPIDRFDRKNRAPKYLNSDRNLMHLTKTAAGVAGTVGKIQIRRRADRATLAKRIGSMIAIVDLLVMEGLVLRDEIEAGIREKVADMAKHY